jgi:hypothetical protein
MAEPQQILLNKVETHVCGALAALESIPKGRAHERV